MILGIVVLLFGAKRLPALATGLGGALRSFRKSATEPDELEGPPAAPTEPTANGSEAEAERAGKAREADGPPRGKSA